MSGRAIRLGRLLQPTGKAVVVACDHGLFDGPHAGMENLGAMLQRLGDGPDGVLLSPGMLRHVQGYFARREAPLPICRLNLNTVLCFHFGYKGAEGAPLFRPEDALAAGAEAVLICITLGGASEATDAHNAQLFAELCTASHRLGLPVIGEYFPHSHLTKTADALHAEIKIGVRMLAELGADCIKTFYTNRFREITATCPIPVFGLGAEKTPTDYDALRLAEAQIAAGAAGVVFGRNAVQASHPAHFIAALHDIVKRGATAADAAARHQLTRPQ
jgi:DhnA family fructose-bisphosphate aldolase class Ia